MPLHGEAKKKYQREWIARKRANWLAEHGPCVKCGSWDTLEIDHVNPEEKSFKISWSRKKEILDKELQKCQVLCENCHLEKTKKDLHNLNFGVLLLEERTVQDSQILEVLQLTKSGFSEREACKLVGISRGTYSSIKIRGYRKELFNVPE